MATPPTADVLLTVEEAARRSGRTLKTAYKALTRLRKLLLDCVTNRLASGEVT